MTVQEFLDGKNPQVMEEAKKCTNIEEFEKLAKKYEIELSPEELNNGFRMYGNPAMEELEDDELNAVSGGKAPKISEKSRDRRGNDPACDDLYHPKNPVASSVCSNCEYFNGGCSKGKTITTMSN